MRKLSFILSCLLLFIQCENSEKRVEVNDQCLFSDCLETKNIEMVEKGISVFYAALRDVFKAQGDADDKAYKKFFDEISQMNLPRTFPTDRRVANYLKELKNISTFSKTYMSYEEQSEQASSEEEEIYITERIDGVRAILKKSYLIFIQSKLQVVL